MAGSRVFELRTYRASPGKIDALHARFRDRTLELFEKHGITVVGFFSPVDEPRKSDTLIYLCVFESREAANASWDAFRSDPEWLDAKMASETDGPLTAEIQSTFLTATEYSALA